ncbi:YIP1 family protein [Dehalococcoidia bacterium]|nr:YIP1 family protein [Dehalococcoidia bacterium]
MQEDILETLIGVLARPTSTIRGICQQRPIGWAIIVYLVVSLVISAITWIETGFYDLEGMGLPDLGMPAVLVGSLIISIITLVISTAICHLVASLLGGRGSYSGLFCGSAFAGLPRIFTAPLAVIGMLPMVGPLLSGLGNFGVMVWSLVLSILAIRENYLISTGRAILIVLIVLLLGVILLVLSGLLAGLLVLGA